MNISQPTPVERTFELAEQIPSFWRGLHLGAAIRHVRRVLHLTQVEVAQGAGIAQSHLARIERGMEPRWDTLMRVFAAMECELILVPKARMPFSQMQSRNYSRWLDRYFSRLRARRESNRR